MTVLKRLAAFLTAVVLALGLAALATMILPEGPQSFTRVTVAQSGVGTEGLGALTGPKDQIVLRPDWPWVDELNLRLQGGAGQTLIVEAAGVKQTIPLPAEDVWLSVPINAYAPEIVLTTPDKGMLTLEDICQEQRVNAPWRLTILCVCMTLVFALWAMKRRTLHGAAFMLLAGLGSAMVLAKLALTPHGWDEYVHRDLVSMFAGQGFTSVAAYVQSFTIWNIGYLPVAVGVAVGRALGLAEQLTYRLGSLCSVWFYASICALAVKRAPKYKLSFLMVAAFPVCVYQAGCYTYDGVVIAFALLGTALLLEEMCSPTRLTTGRTVMLTAPLCLAMLPKPCYCVLLLMLLLLPQEKFASKRQCRKFRLFVVALTLWSAVCLILPGAYDNVLGGDARFEGTDSRAQAAFLLSNPLDAVRILGGYMLREFPKMYLTVPFYLMGSYGGNIFVSVALMAAFLFLCPLCTWNERGASPLSAKRRIALAVLALIPMALLTVAQYLASSPVGGETILGMQERYVLPMWPMLGMAVMLPEGLRVRAKKLSGLMAWGMIPLYCGIYLLCIYFSIVRLWSM